jgi:lipid-A-disaccharide synthase
MPKKFLIVAGEASGDLHGAKLIEQLKLIEPDLIISGIGGSKMREAGLQCLCPMEELSFMGLIEVIRHYGFIRSILNRMKKEIDQRPDCLILIDYPDFNFRLAQYAKSKGVPVFYYIAPQVWAWRSGRAVKMREFVNHLAVVFDFEEEIFKKAGVNVSFVGHPLLDQQDKKLSRDQFYKELSIQHDKTIIGVLPGSRKQEIERILPAMIETCKMLYQKYPNLFFAVSCAASLDFKWLQSFLPCKSEIPVRLLKGRTPEIQHYSKVVMVTSGTATLETALAQTPMIVCYKTSSFSYYLLKPFIKIDSISLVNILAKKGIVPEFVQMNLLPKKMAFEIASLLSNGQKHQTMKEELVKLRIHLGNPGAAERAAQIAFNIALK